jgi:hypothetical protein
MPGRGAAITAQACIWTAFWLLAFSISASAQDAGSNVPQAGFFIGVGGSYNQHGARSHGALVFGVADNIY